MCIANTFVALQPAGFDMLEQSGGGDILLTIHEVLAYKRLGLTRIVV